MKTTTYINRKDIIAIIAVIILFALMMPLKAVNGKNTGSGLSEIQSASAHLALLNNEIEKTVEFTAPELSESFELMTAEIQLADVFGSLEKGVAYNSPDVDDNFETDSALEDLNDLAAEIEQAVKYTSPMAE